MGLTNFDSFSVVFGFFVFALMVIFWNAKCSFGCVSPFSRFQPVTVYEVVMPPNEIRIYHPSAMMFSVSESGTKTQQGPPISTSDPMANGKANEALGGGDSAKGCSTLTQQTNSTSAAVGLPSSSFLYSEAMDVLEKWALHSVFSVVLAFSLNNNQYQNIYQLPTTLFIILEWWPLENISIEENSISSGTFCSHYADSSFFRLVCSFPGL